MRRVAAFEQPVTLLGDRRGFIDLFWKGVLLVEQKSAGRDLTKAKTQALSYFPGLKDADLPRYILLSDFATFELYDLATKAKASPLPSPTCRNTSKSSASSWASRSAPSRIRTQSTLKRLRARPATLHTMRWQLPATPATDLEQFLVRIVFCFFAGRHRHFRATRHFPRPVGKSDAGKTAPTSAAGWRNCSKCSTRPKSAAPIPSSEDLARFPYVNGDLFRDPLLIPSFDAAMRQRLIDACHFNWSDISPAIFGSLFQSVMDKDERARSGGTLHTPNKTSSRSLSRCFSTRLRAEFRRLQSRRDNRRIPELIAFQQRLGQLRFFDPACGCGNFLIIALPRVASVGNRGAQGKSVHTANLTVLGRTAFSGRCGSVLRH